MSSSDRLNVVFISRSRSRISRLNRDVERRRRLVGDDQRRLAGDGHRDQHALPHAAGQLVRVVVDACGRRRESAPPRAARSARAFASRARRAAVHEQRFGDLIADREHRVERRHRLLEDERDLGAAHLPHLALRTASSSSRPLNRMLPPAMRPGGCTSRMIDSAVTDLPLPDSPTSPSVSPARISKLTSSTAGAGPPGRSKTVVRCRRNSESSASDRQTTRQLSIVAI